MTTLRIKRLALATLGATAILALGGCGSSTSETDLAKGRLLFKTNCGTCHTLAEAGYERHDRTRTSTPPSPQAATRAWTDDTIEGVVRPQIESPREMDASRPHLHAADLVEGQDAEDVATYVGSVAGVPGIGPSDRSRRSRRPGLRRQRLRLVPHARRRRHNGHQRARTSTRSCPAEHR